MTDSKECSKCSADRTKDPEIVLKRMPCGHTSCAQCIESYSNRDSSRCPDCQPSLTTVSQDSQGKKRY